MVTTPADRILTEVKSHLHKVVQKYFPWSSSEMLAPEQPFNGLIYDCEIIKCIPAPGLEEDSGLQFCNGWNDFENMGILVIACYDYVDNTYRVFLDDNMSEFSDLVHYRRHVVGFNSLAFDDKLCAFNNIKVTTTYDLLAEVRAASGQPRHYVKGETRSGYSLERLAQANLGYGKSGNGKLAPVLWQQGQDGAVIDYCLQDVVITKKLFEMRSHLTDPTNGDLLQLADPLVVS